MAFFKLISLIHCVILVQLSSYGTANNFSRCNHTNIMESYRHLLQPDAWIVYLKGSATEFSLASSHMNGQRIAAVQLSLEQGDAETNSTDCHERNINTSLIKATSEPHYERENVINCCPLTKGAPKLEALLSCIHNFTRACIASYYPRVWNHTVSLLEANCRGYVGPKMDNIWNATVTHKNSGKCKIQRKKIIENQKCGNHTLQELNEMWKHYVFTD